MKLKINLKMTLLFCSMIVGWFFACENDKIPVPCLCDTTVYRDCECDTDDPEYICDCDTTVYQDCDCDSLQPIYDCDCDRTTFQDCECDSLDPVYDCDCDTSIYIDEGCACDTSTLLIPVSYKNNIQPIWDNYCTGCHGKGDSYVELIPEVSYSALKDAGYINIKDPVEKTKIYDMIINQVMPPQGESYPTKGEIELILRWLSEGASNN